MIAALFVFGNVNAQKIKSLFVSMPDSVSPILTKINREDCIDFLESNMKAKVKNRFGKISELKELTDNYLFMQISPSSSFQMKLLPINDSINIVCMINTYCAAACDSKIEFFDSEWKKLNTKDYISFPQKPSFVDSLLLNSKDGIRETAKLLNMTFKKMTLSPDNTNLTVSYTAIDNLNISDKEKFLAYFKDAVVTFEWDDKKFLISNK